MSINSSTAGAGASNASGVILVGRILLSILFTVYFYRKLAAARAQVGTEW